MLSKAAKPSEGWSEQPQTLPKRKRFFRPPLAPPNLGGETDTQSAEKVIKKKLLTPKMRKSYEKGKMEDRHSGDCVDSDSSTDGTGNHQLLRSWPHLGVKQN